MRIVFPVPQIAGYLNSPDIITFNISAVQDFCAMLDSEGVPHQAKMYTEVGAAASLTMIGDNCELRLAAVGGQNKL